MEYPATWTTDEHGFEKSAHGLNASAVDYAKLGCLYLNGGFFNGNRIIPSSWAVEATVPDFSKKDNPVYYPDWIQQSGLYYNYFWWGNSESVAGYNFFAWGNLGQYIYVIPDTNIVIVRQGREYGLD